MSVSGNARQAGRGLALAALAAAALVVLVVYRPGLDGPLLLDDYVHLEPILHRPPADAQGWLAVLHTHAGPTGRPLAMATFVANAVLGGSVLPTWKLTNVFLHVLAGCLLALLLVQVCASEGRRAERGAWLAAAAVAVLWLVHPLHVSTVLYTVQRMTQLASLFILLGLWLYLDGRRRLQCGMAGGTWRVLAGLGGCLPPALLAKETGALLPLLALIAELTLFAPGPGGRRPPVVTGSFVVLLLPAIAVGAWYALNYEQALGAAYAARPFGPLERLLTESRVVVRYAAQVLYPAPGVFGFIHDDLAVSRSLLSPQSLCLSQSEPSPPSLAHAGGV